MDKDKNKLTDEGRAQTKLAADTVKDLSGALEAAGDSDGDPIAAYADARKILQDITRYVEAAEAAVTPEVAAASETNHPEWKKARAELKRTGEWSEDYPEPKKVGK